MASTMRAAAMKLPSASASGRVAARRSLGASVGLQRCFTRATPLTAANISRTFQRGYADEIRPTAPVVELSNVKKPKRFRKLKWTWRITYLSALAGVGYMIYGVYDLRHPEDQYQPDPTKQNLVILGMQQ